MRSRRRERPRHGASCPTTTYGRCSSEHCFIVYRRLLLVVLSLYVLCILTRVEAHVIHNVVFFMWCSLGLSPPIALLLPPSVPQPSFTRVSFAQGPAPELA